MLEALAVGDVARRREHSLQLAVAVVEGRGVERHHRLRAFARQRGQFVVGDLAFAQHAGDGRLGALRVGEIILERRADQLVAGAAGQGLHLLVDVGDDAARVGGHQRVDIRFDQRARVKLLVAQALVEYRLFGLDLLARRVVGADQQVADDVFAVVAQRRDGHDGGEAAAVLTDIGQLINVLDAARGLEHQRLEARRDGRAQFGAERVGAGDDFVRIGDVGRRDLVDDIGGDVAQHAFGADVENLDDAVRIGGDAGEIGAVENRLLQRAGFQQFLLGLFAGRVVGADQQVAYDVFAFVAQGRDRDDGRQPAAILADIGQLINILDAARGLEHQRLEARRDGRAQFGAERVGAGDDLVRIGDVGRRDLVDDVGRHVTEHAFGADVENLDDAVRIGGDAGEVGAVEDRLLQRAGFQQFLLGLFAGRVVGADQQVAYDVFAFVAQGRDRDDGRQPAAILADIGQLINILDAARGLEHQRLEAGRDGRVELQAQGGGAGQQLGRIGNVGGGDLVDHLGGLEAQHALGADVENLDHALRIGGDAGEIGTVENSVLQGAGFQQQLPIVE